MLRKEEFGTLVVDLSPLEAQLLVDTIDLGPGPRTVERIAVGTHQVEGRVDGYTPLRQDVTITANAVIRLDLALTVVPAPLPMTTPEVVQRDPRPWARIAANSVVSAAAVGAGAMSFVRYQHARSAYDTSAAIESETEAEAYFTENVVPPRTQAAVLGIGALLGSGDATALWVTTDFGATALTPRRWVRWSAPPSAWGWRSGRARAPRCPRCAVRRGGSHSGR